MGFVHYVHKRPSREKLLRGETPAWIANSSRGKYIAAVVLSAPPWVNRKELFAMHAEARRLTLETGIEHQMDHIVPLNHPRVCGLTVPWNIQIIKAKPNMSKGNSWCPEQQELFP